MTQPVDIKRTPAPAPGQERPGSRSSLRASPTEERLLLGTLQGTPHLNPVILCVRIPGAVRVASIRRALFVLVDAHEGLRSTFHAESGRVYRTIHRELDYEFQDVRVSGVPTHERERLLQGVGSAFVHREYDSIKGPLLRAARVRFDETEQFLILSTCHLACDLVGLYMLVRRLAEMCRESEREAQDIPSAGTWQAAEFVDWQRRQLTEERLATTRDYWRRMHGDQSLHVPLFGNRPVARRDRSSLRALTTSLPSALASCQNRTARASVALAAAAAACSGERRPTIALPVMNRTRVETLETVGFLANTLPLRIDVAPQHSVAEQVLAAKHIIKEARGFEDVPFASVMGALSGTPNLALNYFPTMRRQLPDGFDVHIPGLPPAMATPFDASIYLIEAFGTAQLQYFADNLTDEQSAELLRAFSAELTNACAA